jgi:hypothetical protein
MSQEIIPLCGGRQLPCGLWPRPGGPLLYVVSPGGLDVVYAHRLHDDYR